MHDDEQDDIFDDDTDMASLTARQRDHQIDDLLMEHRPERYSSDDKRWQIPILEKVREQVRNNPPKEVVRDFAQYLVSRRESAATQRANRILKNICMDGQLPLGWGEDGWKEVMKDVLYLPLSIAKKQRIVLAAMTLADWQEWLRDYDDASKKLDASRNKTADGARFFIKAMSEQGALRTDQLRAE